MVRREQTSQKNLKFLIKCLTSPRTPLTPKENNGLILWRKNYVE
jgi:hypothetical protein